MSSKWRVGSIDVFVAEQGINREIKRAELFVLDSTTSVFQFFGAGSEKRAIKGVVIGEANKDALIALAIGNTSFTLASPYGNLGGAKINGAPKFSNLKYSGGVIDGVDYDASVTPIYTVELEVIAA
jgi:hypothetical protein